MSPGMRYGVKLYGHLSDDKDRFAHQLADVLNMDVENASALMQNVPVVILPSASKDEAERLARDLAAIRALYLVEPEGEEPEPDAPQKPLLDVLPEPKTDGDAKENLRHGYMGMALLLGGVAIVLVVGSVSLYSMFKRMRAENQGPVTPPRVEEPSSQAGSDSAHGRPSEAGLLAQIDGLYARNEQLKSLIRLKEDEVRSGTSSFSMDFEAVRRSRQQLGELQDEMRGNIREISELKGAISRLAPPKADRFE